MRTCPKRCSHRWAFPLGFPPTSEKRDLSPLLLRMVWPVKLFYLTCRVILDYFRRSASLFLLMQIIILKYLEDLWWEPILHLLLILLYTFLSGAIKWVFDRITKCITLLINNTRYGISNFNLLVIHYIQLILVDKSKGNRV